MVVNETNPARSIARLRRCQAARSFNSELARTWTRMACLSLSTCLKHRSKWLGPSSMTALLEHDCNTVRLLHRSGFRSHAYQQTCRQADLMEWFQVSRSTPQAASPAQPAWPPSQLLAASAELQLDLDGILHDCGHQLMPTQSCQLIS